MSGYSEHGSQPAAIAIPVDDGAPDVRQRSRMPLSTILLLLRHEARLARRDLAYLLTAGHRWRLSTVLLVLAIGFIIMHLVAFGMVARYAEETAAADIGIYISLTGTILLSLMLMLSQALEKVTRLFYAQGDLDLLASSPVSLRLIFMLRIGNTAVSTLGMACFVLIPFVNILVWLGGAHWLSAFGLAIAGACTASGFALILTAILFDTLGPRRTRLISQIVSAVVGSAFVIGIQAAAILSIGRLSQQALFDSDLLHSHAPAVTSPFWLPARAALGDLHALLACILFGLGSLTIPLLLLARHVGGYALSASSAVLSARHKRSRLGWFATTSPRLLLWRKEWLLLWRDPWLASQSLMQLLYLIPPALLLWRFYGHDRGALIVLAPVLTMAAGQLAGGLAWLAVSGEDAPDLIATAPISPVRALTGKVEAVLMLIFLIFAPFLLGLAGLSLEMTLVVAIGIVAASVSSTMIQIWFRSQAKRRYFSRRQTSSRIATFTEAFCAVSWAAAAGLWLQNPAFAVVPIIIALLILFAARALRPA
jgi:ABC-2 type transport system permease protein